MFLAKVEGSVVATKKDPAMFRPGMNTIGAVDSVGAGIG